MIPDPTTPEPNTFVEAFARGLAVIEAFGSNYTELSLSEVASRTGVSRAAARRLLLTLCHLGYAINTGSTFCLTPKVMRLGYSYISGLTIREIVEPYVAAVANETEESCSVCVLDDLDVVYIARASVSRIMSINLSLGTRLPAWATAHGRVLLAGLSDKDLDDRLRRSDIRQLTPHSITDRKQLAKEIRLARENGYCFVNQELELSLTAIAMPLCDRTGHVIAAINLAGHVERNTKEKMLSVHLPILRKAAEEINAALKAR